MENVLNIYERPYDPQNPVVCFDEKPLQLLGQKTEPLPAGPGQPLREDYEYVRNGTACLLMAMEPLTGRRWAKVTERRTRQDYALFMKELQGEFPEAARITLVQDNLNTHTKGSFYETFPAAEAAALSQRFDFQYTPKKGSWLNMAEIEFAAMEKQCLDRRIADIETMRREVAALVQERNEKQIKVEWQFTVTNARDKFDRHYQNAINKN